MASNKERVTVALEWAPNTNHTGFYLAKAKGYYAEVGLEVDLISPHEDNYAVTPASKVVDGTVTFGVAASETIICYHTLHAATFGLAPSETVISYHSNLPGSVQAQRPKLVAIATLLASDTSSIVTLATSGIDTPAKLDGKVYASYGARYEGRIVQCMIRNAGGKGEFKESTPDKLGIWHTLLEGEADATWIFNGWEGVQAKRQGIKLNFFSPQDFGVPYGYTPLLVAHPDLLKSRPDMVRAFLAATARGFEEAAAQPKPSAEIFVVQAGLEHAAIPLSEPLDRDMVIASQEYVSQHYLGPSGHWGVMDAAHWEAFLNWLSTSGLLTSKMQSRTPVEGTSTTLDGLRSGDVGAPVPREFIGADALFTNEFLPVA